MDDLERFIYMSNWAGERFDLIQGRGGNTSVKLDAKSFLVKESGCSLFEMSKESGYVKVSIPKVLAILEDPKFSHIKTKNERENLVKRSLSEACLDDSLKRPSIETFLHAFFEKYTLHFHPISILGILCLGNWKEILNDLFPHSMLVNYATPGLELGLEISKEIKDYQKTKQRLPQIIFLQNHGMLISGTSVERVIQMVEETVCKIERFTGYSLERFKLAPKINEIILNTGDLELKAYLSEDEILKQVLRENEDSFFSGPLCPDDFVFCGAYPIQFFSSRNVEEFYDLWKSYKRKYLTHPKVLVFDHSIFFLCSSFLKAKEMEQVFKAHLLAIWHHQNKVNFLSEDEMRFLATWEAENFRFKFTK